MKTLIVLLTALIFFTGCQSLIINDNDGALKTTGKVTGRVLLGASTIGLSEFKYRQWRQTDKLNKIMASWKGEHQSDLILKWGPPQRKSSDGNGGKVFVYENIANTRMNGVAINYGGGFSTVHANNTSYKQTRMFYVNNKGIIYAYRWQGI